MIDSLFDLTGKVALVTGGSRGLGREIALAFAAHGADVIVASRKYDACETVAEQIRALGRRALAVAAHVGKWEEIDALVERSYAAFGRVDILVNNAGMGPRVPSHEMTEDLFDKVVALNFKGPFRLAALIAQRMAEGEGGAIINVSSSGAIVPLPQVVAYAGAKAALNAMTRSMAREYGPKVRSNVLSAGPFLTDIAKSWTDDMRKRTDSAIGRPGDPSEIVTSALYLASPASSYTTGAILRVDGGLD